MKKRRRLPRGVFIRGSTYYVSITRNGRRIKHPVGRVELSEPSTRNQQPALSLDEVVAIRNLKIAEAIKEDEGVPKPRKPLTIRALREAYIATLPEGGTRAKHAKRYFGNLTRILGDGTLAETLSLHALVRYRAERGREVLKSIPKTKRTVSPATVSRELACLRAALRWARRKRSTELRVNVFEGMEKAERRSVFPLEEAAVLPRLVSDEELEKFLAALPEAYRSPVRFAALTGMRKQEVFGLTWEHVHESATPPFVRPTKTKSGRARAVALSTVALALLDKRPKEGGLVFKGPSGTPLWNNFARAWNAARAASGLSGFRMHHLRHRWASRMIEAGADLRTLQETGGWSDLSLVERYAHTSVSRASEIVEKVANPSRKGASVVPIRSQQAG